MGPCGLKTGPAGPQLRFVTDKRTIMMFEGIFLSQGVQLKNKQTATFPDATCIYIILLYFTLHAPPTRWQTEMRSYF